jgi:hypothetical protein
MAEFIQVTGFLINPHRIDFVKMRGSMQDPILEVYFHGNPPNGDGLVLEGIAAEELMRVIVKETELIDLKKPKPDEPATAEQVSTVDLD